MDAFYASVEIRDNPALRGLPLVVGGAPDERGVVAAASYEARRYGVHSAMPSATAARLCPDLIFVPARYAHYAEVSRQIRAIFERYTPVIEPLALDEAFLDITASRRLWGGSRNIGTRIKADIHTELGLTASVGIAPNKFVAKLASDLDKPDGLVVVPPGRVQATLDPLPVRRLWGVGRSGERRLREAGAATVSDLRALSSGFLSARFGDWGLHLWSVANGIDDRPVVTDRDAKSISHEKTFVRDIDEHAVLDEVLLRLTEQVASRLRHGSRQAATVSVKVRYPDFATPTRSRTLARATDITAEILQTARRLMAGMLRHRPGPIRLLGVGVSGLSERGGEQPDLFDRARDRQREMDAVADEVNRRFGGHALQRGVKRGP